MFIDINQKFIKVNGKCDRALTSSDDKERTKSDKTVRQALLLSHKVQKGPPCILITSERSLVAAGSSFTPRIEQYLKDYEYVHNQALLSLS